MKQTYASGDPYLEFAKLAGAVPPDATKKSHLKERALYKETVLAVNYGMGEESLAERIQLKFVLTANRRELVSLRELLGNQAELSMVFR